MQGQSKIDMCEFSLNEFLPVISEVIESGGEFRLYPKGTSMLPLLRQGKDSVILVKPSSRQSKKDIILYKRNNGQIVLHRIVGMKKDGEYVLCGDNQTALEYGITHDMVVAQVSAVYRGEKRLEKSSFRRGSFEFFWCIMPLRKFIMRVKRVLGKIKRKIFH